MQNMKNRFKDLTMEDKIEFQLLTRCYKTSQSS